jgi:hypothetical protein
MVNTLVALAETTPAEGGVNPWIVGPSVFAILVLVLLALISFGGGRDHS